MEEFEHAMNLPTNKDSISTWNRILLSFTSLLFHLISDSAFQLIQNTLLEEQNSVISGKTWKIEFYRYNILGSVIVSTK